VKQLKGFQFSSVFVQKEAIVAYSAQQQISAFMSKGEIILLQGIKRVNTT